MYCEFCLTKLTQGTHILPTERHCLLLVSFHFIFSFYIYIVLFILYFLSLCTSCMIYNSNIIIILTIFCVVFFVLNVKYYILHVYGITTVKRYTLNIVTNISCV